MIDFGLPPHTLENRRDAVRAAMRANGIDTLVLCSTGLHMIDLDNSLLHLTGFKSVGPALALFTADGDLSLLVSPADDHERARAVATAARACDDLREGIAALMANASGTIASVGLDAMPWRIARMVAGDGTPRFDDAFAVATARKTDAELAAAARATRIAEAAYVKLKEWARPGLRECDLATELNLFMKGEGADDCFLMLNAGPRADAVMPSSERPLERGDLILVELSPSVDGQFVQICRTVSLGEPRPEVTAGYDLLVAAMREGIARVRPGAPMGEVCGAIDDFLSGHGFAQFSRPPFIRRRGHGLGAGSTFPGDVAVDNATPLEAGMVFIVHPNQFLPATGYMMCGEPLVVGAEGAIRLSLREACLDTVAL